MVKYLAVIKTNKRNLIKNEKTSMNEHYYTENPLSAVKEKTFKTSIRNITLELTSVSGVFAFSNNVDRASRLLIESFSPSGNAILDLGCGYGAIGLFAKALYKEQEVFMSDINSRAVEYAMLNAKKNKLDVKIIKSDLFSGLNGMKFDDIVSNPPMAAGKKVISELINQSYDHLNPKGALWLVAFHNKGGLSFRTIMESKFGNVSDMVKSGGIRVYKAIRN